MKLITKDTCYSFKALCYIISNKKKIIAVEELSKKTKIPKPFLRKLLQILSRNKMIRSYKGKGGGFAFVKDPGKVFLTDLMEVFQGGFKLADHMVKKKKCPEINMCNLRKKIDKIESIVMEELSNTSIKSLLK